MRIIERRKYLQDMINAIGTPDVKVLTGVRRCGKSKLMEALSDYICKKYPDANIVHINYNLTEFEHILEYHALEDYVETQYLKGKMNFLLIDEIQMCEGFEKAINSLHAKEKFDIYVTGSNAFLQSSDLATLFVGRTFEIHVLPFSYEEYCLYHSDAKSSDALASYITEGGLAGSYLYKDARQKYNYIANDVLNALIVRDIINKYKIRNEQLLNQLIDFLMDNVGNLTSIRKLTVSLENDYDTKADKNTVGRYVEYLCRAFAFYRVRRYDIRGKRYLNTEDKYYLSDQAFKYARLGTKNMDYGRVLENIVAMELIRRGYEVYVGILYDKEIDFVAQKSGEKEYIQVAYNISDPETFKREISPLLKISDGYPKTIIARTYQPEYQHEGIHIIDAEDWLTSCSSDNG